MNAALADSSDSSVPGLDTLSVAGKRVWIRVDFNVPLAVGADGAITVGDDTRLLESLPTIREICDKGGRVILASHLGRPKGKADPALSLAPVAKRLAELLGVPVAFVPACVGEAAEAAAAKLRDGEVLLLENLRFHAEEEANDAAFAARLAKTADVYVNDAFGTAHRAHASTHGIVAHVPAAAAGRLMDKEISFLGRLLAKPARPFVVVLGGAKISGKIDVIENLLPRIDTLCIGGGLANNFLAARGQDIGKSLVELDKVPLALRILERAEREGIEIELPYDLVVTDDIDSPSSIDWVRVSGVPANKMIVDIGESTYEMFRAAILDAKTLFWNGPMGVFERTEFATGTMEIAHAIADSGAMSIVGGGESVAALHAAGVADKITHISTGGGASLEFLAGKALPGVEILRQSGRK